MSREFPWISLVSLSAIVFFRLVEEVKLQASSCQLQNEDVYMNTTFQEFIQMCIRKLRGEDDEEELVVDYVSTIGSVWILRTAVTDW